MMGRQNNDQGPLFYEFCLDEAVPADHLVRTIDAVLDLSWVYAELAPQYPTLGRPSVDPVLMIRMLIIGYVFGLRSDRLLCREVQVNLAYRWFCKLGIEHKIPDHSAFSRARNERFRDSGIFRQVFEHVVEACIQADANKQRSIPTGSAVVCCRGGCRSRWKRHSASRHSRTLWLITASRRYSTRIRVRNSRARHSPVCSPTTALRSAWTVKELGGTMSSSSDCGAAFQCHSGGKP